MAGRYYNIIVVPGDHSGTRQYRVSAQLWWTAVGLGALFALVLLIFVLTYGRVLARANDADDLEAENRQLRDQVGLVRQLSTELEELSALRAQVLQLLGHRTGELELDPEGTGATTAGLQLSTMSTEDLAQLFASEARRSYAPRQWPAAGGVDREFTRSAEGGDEAHPGLDIGGSVGDPVRASGRGRVVETGYEDERGNYLVVDHGFGFRTTYAYLQRILAREGQTVEAGQEIAYLGQSGDAGQPHLHFEIQVDGEPVDPRRYLTPR